MTRHQSLVAVPTVVLLLACVGCGGGGAGGGYNTPGAPSGQTPGTDVAIAIVGNAGAQSFNPNPSNVRMGQTVAWRNSDSIVHHIVEDVVDTSTGTSGGGYYGDGGGNPSSGFDGGQEAPGAMSSTLTARTAGTLHYHCAIHPGMVGTLTVTP